MKSTLAITAVIFTIGVLTIPIVRGDTDFSWRGLEELEHKSTGVSAATNPVYKDECGSCHMAYPPGLLPAKSWTKIMSGLDNHFGDNAELDAKTGQVIGEFLRVNSADKSDYRRSKNFSRSIQPGDTPVRITDTPYFKRKHDEIPARMVSGNPKVNSFSQCTACHAKAEQGVFNEDTVSIPGYGRWDD
jgi:hypothetical protein